MNKWSHIISSTPLSDVLVGTNEEVHSCHNII